MSGIGRRAGVRLNKVSLSEGFYRAVGPTPRCILEGKLDKRAAAIVHERRFEGPPYFQRPSPPLRKTRVDPPQPGTSAANPNRRGSPPGARSRCIGEPHKTTGASVTIHISEAYVTTGVSHLPRSTFPHARVFEDARLRPMSVVCLSGRRPGLTASLLG